MEGEEHVLPPLHLGDYEVERSRDNLLGEGGFGKVWRGCHVTSLDHVAVKQVQKNDRTRRFLDRELLFLTQLKHENIIKVFDTKQTDHSAYIIMEYCRLGNLSEFMRNNAIHITKCTGFMMELTRAMMYLHAEQKICHRDVKPDNVLLTNDGEHVKMADFGLAREFIPQSSTPLTGSGVGTYGWLAPEVLQMTDGGRKYSFPADIFSLGLLFLALIKLQVPSSRAGNLYPYAVDGVPLGHWLSARGDGLLPQIHSPEDDTRIVAMCKTLILRMLCLRPEERYTIDQVYNHMLDIHNQATAAENVLPDEVAVSDLDEGVAIVESPGPASPVELICRHELPFRADNIAGLSSDGRILFAYTDNLFLYELANRKYKQVWKKSAPSFVSQILNYKSIDRNGDILLQHWEEGSVTARFTHDLQPITQHDRRGVLLDCLPEGGHVAYARGTLAKYDWKVEIWAGDEKAMTLRHPSTTGRLSRLVRSGWGWMHSICAAEDRIVIVESVSRTMAIFTEQGELLEHQTLDYEPAERKAVTFGDGRILVAGYWAPAIIHVYNLNGVKLGTAIKHDQLGLPGNVQIQGIRCTEEGVLVLLAGLGMTIASMHAYKLNL